MKWVSTTRYPSQPERRPAIAGLVRASAAVATMTLVLGARRRIERLIIGVSATADGPRIVTFVAVGIGSVAALNLIKGLWHVERWRRASRYERMLHDPSRAASVPPLRSHLDELRRQSPLSTPAVRWLIGVVLILVYILLPRTRTSDTTDRTGRLTHVQMIAVGAAVAVLLLAVAVMVIGRWLRARRVERLSADPALASAPAPALVIGDRATVDSRPAPADPVPEDQSGRSSVTLERNLIGGSPWRIVYLRLFDNDARLREFLEGPWRACGHVRLLRAAESVSEDEADAASTGRPMFINSTDWLLAELARQQREPLAPGKHELLGAAGQAVKVHDPFGAYPVQALLCHTSFWKQALDLLLERSDVALLDLSGYQWKNVGSGYEMQRLIDRFPIEHTVFLADQGSDDAFLHAQLTAAWARMATASPNRGRPPADIAVVETGGSNWTTAVEIARKLQVRLNSGARH